MKTYLFIPLFIFGLIITSCDSPVTRDNYYSKISELYTYEADNIVSFLSLEGSYNQSFWSSNFVISCKIKNQAKVSACKDVVIRITYVSPTNSVIITEDYTIYKVFNPQSEKDVEFEIKNYKDVASLKWEIIGAIGIMK